MPPPLPPPTLVPPVRPSWLDRVIGWASPSRGLRRQRARVALLTLREYEGAARSRRTEGWRMTHGTSANTELAWSLPLLRDRSRDHVRNNPYGRRAARRLASALVGYGITGTVTDTGEDTARVERVQALWDAWASTTACDLRNKQTFGGMQRLVARTLVESGEVLTRRVWDAAAPMGFRLQVLEPDYLDAVPGQFVGGAPTPLDDGHRILSGVEVDGTDRPVAYWLMPHHPGDVWVGQIGMPVRVDAVDIAHVFDEERAGQMRGCPMLAPVMIPLRDLDECKDAHQVRQKVAACFSVFYLTPDGATRSRQDPLTDHVEPGLIEELPPGYEVQFANPPGVEGYADVMRIGLQAVAAGTSVPYEEISGDFSQFNFASGRMSRGAFFEYVEETQWQVIVPGFCDRVWAWFTEAAAVRGVDTAGLTMTWTMPRRPLVDPQREIPPTIAAVRATLTSPQEAIRELGYNPREILAEWDTFQGWLDDLGVKSDLDPRWSTIPGARPRGVDQTTGAPTAPPPVRRRGVPRRGVRPAPPATNGDTPHDPDDLAD
jgi:lambda family phage portal protein